jgi:hypothetical protein
MGPNLKTKFPAQSAESARKRIGPQSESPGVPSVNWTLTGGANFPKWQLERAGRLHRQFLRVESRRKKVGGVDRCLKNFEWYWRGATYRTEPKCEVRFSLNTLRRLFYFWKKNGRTSECLLLRYRYNPNHESKVSPDLLAEFVSICITPGVNSMAQAYSYFSIAHEYLWEGTGPAPAFPSRASFYRALSAEKRQTIFNYCKANRALLKAREKFKQAFRFG